MFTANTCKDKSYESRKKTEYAITIGKRRVLLNILTIYMPLKIPPQISIGF